LSKIQALAIVKRSARGRPGPEGTQWASAPLLVQAVEMGKLGSIKVQDVPLKTIGRNGGIFR
jgi:hypothetical protein